jgi:hypothetical protein
MILEFSFSSTVTDWGLGDRILFRAIGSAFLFAITSRSALGLPINFVPGGARNAFRWDKPAGT